MVEVGWVLVEKPKCSSKEGVSPAWMMLFALYKFMLVDNIDIVGLFKSLPESFILTQIFFYQVQGVSLVLPNIMYLGY